MAYKLLGEGKEREEVTQIVLRTLRKSPMSI